MATATKTRKSTAKKAPAKAKAEKAPKTMNACECFSVEVGRTADDEPIFGSCGEQTARRFAPGHDAKLKGALILCAVNGWSYNVQDGGSLTAYDPRKVADVRGWSHFIDRAVERSAARAKATEARLAAREAAKAEREAAKQAKAAERAAAKAAKTKAASTEVGSEVKVKIGRFTYDAIVESESVNSVTVSYEDRKGNAKSADVKRSQLVA